MIALAGCSGLTGGAGDGQTTAPEQGVAVEDGSPGAETVTQTLRITVDEETAGGEWTVVGATYPRGDFVVDSAAHEEVVLGVDTDGDGELDRRFNETHISGNDDEFSFDVTLHTEDTPEEGDVVVVGYPAVDNPDEAGDYDIEVRLNGGQTATSTATIG